MKSGIKIRISIGEIYLEGVSRELKVNLKFIKLTMAKDLADSGCQGE